MYFYLLLTNSCAVTFIGNGSQIYVMLCEIPGDHNTAIVQSSISGVFFDSEDNISCCCVRISGF